MGISQYALAKAIAVPPRRINEIVKGLRGITVDTALRLGAYFGTDAQSWINLQTYFDTELAREAKRRFLFRCVPCMAPSQSGAWKSRSQTVEQLGKTDVSRFYVSNWPLATVDIAQAAIENIATQAFDILAAPFTNSLTHYRLLCAVRKL